MNTTSLDMKEEKKKKRLIKEETQRLFLVTAVDSRDGNEMLFTIVTRSTQEVARTTGGAVLQHYMRDATPHIRYDIVVLEWDMDIGCYCVIPNDKVASTTVEHDFTRIEECKQCPCNPCQTCVDKEDYEYITMPHKRCDHDDKECVATGKERLFLVTVRSPEDVLHVRLVVHSTASVSVLTAMMCFPKIGTHVTSPFNIVVQPWGPPPGKFIIVGEENEITGREVQDMWIVRDCVTCNKPTDYEDEEGDEEDEEDCDDTKSN
jgi:hypothetical protein